MTATATHHTCVIRKNTTALCKHPVQSNLGDVVEGKVEVLQLLHVMQVLHLADDVVLEVQNL